jgi:hypothetical protein
MKQRLKDTLYSIKAGIAHELAAQLSDATVKLGNRLAALESEALENLQQAMTFQRYAEPEFTQNWLWGNPLYDDYMGFWVAPAEKP